MRCLLIILFLYVFPAKANILKVGSGQHYSSVRAGLSAARNGDTVLVYPGIYREGNLVIDKSIVFAGIDKPVLDGQKKYEILSVKSPGVIIRGFRLENSGNASLDDLGAVKVYDASSVIIEDNFLKDNFFGVYIQYGKHCIVRNNQIISSGKAEQEIGNGIHCWKSDSLEITGNSIQGHRDGIYFEFVTHSVIWRNMAEGNIRYGLHFMFSNNDSYFTNYFKNNGAGVAVMFSKNVVMMNNTFEANWGDAAYGLLLKEISDCLLSGNRFLRNTTGILMDGTSRMRLERNTFSGNGWGMKIQANCMDNEVEYSNFLGNTIDVSTNGTLVLNNFSDNYWDRYEGYDLDKNGTGDVPYRPLSLFAVIVEKNPSVMFLFRSFMVTLMEKSEKIIPGLTPENFIDNKPRMKPWPWYD